MKTYTYILLALIGLASTSCEDLTNFDDPASVRKAKARSEFILLCEIGQKDGILIYKMLEVLYSKPGVKIPWTFGELVPAPLLDTSEARRDPDKAVIFYETFGGQIRPMETQLFYLSAPNDDGAKLQKVVGAIKQSVGSGLNGANLRVVWE